MAQVITETDMPGLAAWASGRDRAGRRTRRSALTAAKPLEPRTGLRVDAIGEPARGVLAMGHRRELAEKRRGAALSHLLATRSPDCGVGRDEEHRLARASLGREPLEHRVGMGSEADAEGTDLPVLPHAVEDHDAAGAAHRHEARELVDELVAVSEPARVEEIRAVEQIEGDFRDISTSGRG